jgi:hypothetical protein
MTILLILSNIVRIIVLNILVNNLAVLVFILYAIFKNESNHNKLL